MAGKNKFSLAVNAQDEDECCCRLCRFTDGDGLPVAIAASLADVKEQAYILSAAIFAHWILLNKTLKRFEAIIRKRWIKKTHNQRTAVLLAAWPSMASTHRPDFAELRQLGRNRNKRRVDKTKEREAFLWPHINQEDLVEPYHLIMLLNSRGRCLPDRFAFSDHASAHCSKTPKSECEDINQHRMMLYGKQTPKAYGSISRYKAGDKTDMLGMHPCIGLLVLEIQERILRFLIACCRLILHDIDINSNSTNKDPTLSVPAMIRPLTSSWPTVTAMANEAPYRRPHQFDLNRLLMLVDTKRCEAEEHVWALREDPGYFALNLRDWVEHTTALVHDKYKRQHSSVGTAGFYIDVCKEMIDHAYRSLVSFDELYQGLQVVSGQTLLVGKYVRTTKRLPPLLEDTFEIMDELVRQMRESSLGDLAFGFPGSPPIRSDYERQTDDDFVRIQDLVTKRKHNDSVWHVRVLFCTLLSKEQRDKHGLGNIVGEIQRMLDEGGVDSDGITSWVASRFSDLAMITEIEHQLDLFQPWSTMWRHPANPSRTFEPIEAIVQMHNAFVHSLEHVEFPDINPANFVYPSDKRSTKETVERMRLSEKNLDDLWLKIDESCAVSAGSTTLNLYRTCFAEKRRHLHRTRAWVEPFHNRTTQGEKAAEPIQEHESSRSFNPLRDLDTNARQSTSCKSSTLLKCSAERVKLKTRPFSQPKIESLQTQPTQSSGADGDKSTMAITVNKRAYKVFATLFHMPSALEHHKRGELPWTEFLYAMHSIGFSPEKLYGSSWNFLPTGINVKRSIQFHEPHPDAKMRFWVARRMGRRLSRVFGWEGHTFVCE